MLTLEYTLKKNNSNPTHTNIYIYIQTCNPIALKSCPLKIITDLRKHNLVEPLHIAHGRERGRRIAVEIAETVKAERSSQPATTGGTNVISQTIPLPSSRWLRPFTHLPPLCPN